MGRHYCCDCGGTIPPIPVTYAILPNGKRRCGRCQIQPETRQQRLDRETARALALTEMRDCEQKGQAV